MKSLPEENNSLENRLKNYSEAPPELAWENIQAAMTPTDDSTGVIWRDRTAAIAVIAFLTWFAFHNFSALSSDQIKTEVPTIKKSVDQNQREISTPAAPLETFSLKSPDVKTSKSDAQNTPDHSRQNEQKEMRSFSSVSVKALTPDANGNQTAIVNEAEFMATPMLLRHSDSDSSTKKIDSLLIIKKERHDSVAMPNKIVVPGKQGLPFTFYGFLTPSLSFLSITPKPNDSYIMQQFQNPSIMSTQRLGLSLDLGIQGMITERLGYLAGVSLYYQNQSYAYSGIRADKTTFNEQTQKDEPVPFSRTLKYTMLNGGVQGGLMYTLIQSPLTHKIGVALQYQQGMYHSEGSYNNAASRYFNYEIFYRIELAADSRTSFILQPAFFAPIKTNESPATPFTLKHFRAGIGVGFSYKINDQKKKLQTVRPNQSNR